MSIEWPKTDNEAEGRYRSYRNSDPFPSIEPALLNSADIADYARVCGTMFPFPLEKESLKGASIEIPFLGDLYTYKGGEREHTKIEKAQKYTLDPNQIYFLHLSTILRLPNYLAARFNFSIRHVHAGLLLGTGPLVDPGFTGQLLVPIHNLTSSKYEIMGGEGLLWFEFTKISPIAKWRSNTASTARLGEFVEFPDDKKKQSLASYLSKAQPGGRPIQSSLREMFKRTEEILEDAKEQKKKLDRNISISYAALAFTLIAVFVSVAGVAFAAYQLIVAARAFHQDGAGAPSKTVRQLEQDIETQNKKIQALEQGLSQLERKPATKPVPKKAKN
jgi:hypothetical protein